MTPVAYIALLGWIPFVTVLFAVIPVRMAAAIAVIGAWLLLPPYTLEISGLPDYSKITAATLGMILGSLIFDTVRILKFRPRWFDLPMLLWCFTGLCSSLQNGLGLYDGLADSLAQILTWGLPYLFGRLYFGDLEGLRYFTVAMVIGALSYVLPCLWEVRMSPQLLRSIYGYGVWQGTRWGGYRPNVFFMTGLELGLWMTAASLTGWWLWWCGAIKKIGGYPFGSVLLPILMITTILCRSTGALALLAFGTMVLWLSARLKTRLLVAGLLLAGPVYVGVRVPNLWSGQQAVDFVKSSLSEERALSLGYRFMCEQLLIARAFEHPAFGWAGWDRSSVYFNADKPWRKRVPTDGLWIIILGTKGFIGLTCLYVALILPAAQFIWQFPARLWVDPRLAAGSVAAVLLALYVTDCLLNGFVNIIYITLAGALMGVEPQLFRVKAVNRTGVALAASTGQLALMDHNRSLGRALKAEGRLQEAEAVWRRTLDLLSGLTMAYPNDVGLQQRCCDCANDLVWLCANYDTGHRDLSAAVAMAKRLVEQCPDAATYWNTLGVAHYRAGDDGLAIAALKRATALGTSAFDEVFLAMAYARSGDREESERRLAQAELQMARDYAGHPELGRFCDEARAVLAEKH